MITKLTLSIEKEVIEKAKEYAKNQGRSLSNIIEEYLKSISFKKASKEDKQFHPIIEELSGSIKLPLNTTADDILTKALMEKYIKE